MFPEGETVSGQQTLAFCEVPPFTFTQHALTENSCPKVVVGGSAL